MTQPSCSQSLDLERSAFIGVCRRVCCGSVEPSAPVTTCPGMAVSYHRSQLQLEDGHTSWQTPWYELTSLEAGVKPFRFIGVSIEICCWSGWLALVTPSRSLPLSAALKDMARTCSQLFAGCAVTSLSCPCCMYLSAFV